MNRLSWSLARQYLASLKMVGFTVKTGNYYEITPEGWKYYNLFMEEFNNRMNAPAKWQQPVINDQKQQQPQPTHYEIAAKSLN